MSRLARSVTVAALLALIIGAAGQLTVVQAAKKSCPLPDPSIPIPFIIDPVKCQGCEYVNEYAAEAAGWDMDAPYCKYLNPRS